jgi:N4-bis(aminopropyl)spermidine synthase
MLRLRPTRQSSCPPRVGKHRHDRTRANLRVFSASVERAEIDLRAAINAVSDVVQNRPRPLREFDQIYMKTGDMVLQSELVAHWANGRRLAFIGDGDAISVCVAYLKQREILPYGPSRIVVFDFDERMCNSVKRFADRERLETLDACRYNCFDAFPDAGMFDCFYTNPPWGASNGGESVNVFAQRGMEAIGYAGDGMIVIADDPELAWPKEVLANVEEFVLSQEFVVQRLMPEVHSYHLDDAPNLRSCNLMIRSLSSEKREVASDRMAPQAFPNFYGRGNLPWVRYVRERSVIAYGTAHEEEYALEALEQPSE